MTLRRIKVECYAGQRADERPRRVTIGDREHRIARLLAERVEESFVTKGRTRRYKVLTYEGLVLEILHAGDDAWYIESEPSANQRGPAQR